MELMDRHLSFCKTLICQEKDLRGTESWENPRGDHRGDGRNQNVFSYFLLFKFLLRADRFLSAFTFKWLSLSLS